MFLPWDASPCEDASSGDLETSSSGVEKVRERGKLLALKKAKIRETCR